MIRKFEDILRNSLARNRIAYEFLVKKLRARKYGKEKIVCYIGTGLSFYYKSWGEPFEEIMNLYLQGGDAESEKLREMYSKEKYVELAEKLDEKIREKNKRGDINIGSFNEWFCRCLRDKKVEVEEKYENIIEGYIDKEILRIPRASIYYVPYYAYHLITTNCDDSLHRAYIDVKKKEPYKVIGTQIDMGDVADCQGIEDRGKNPGLSLSFYIHGYWHNPASLIMTESSYKKAYSEEIANITYQQEALKALVERNNVIFIGVGFNKDKVLDFLTPFFHIDRTLCFCCTDNGNSIEKANELSRKKMNVIALPEFQDYSIILEQALRDVENPYWDRKKIRKNVESNVQDVEKEWFDALKKWLNEKQAWGYLEIDLHKESARKLENGFWNLLWWLLSPNVEYTEMWRICYIANENFSFEEKDVLELPAYNLPLGNTIYFARKSEIRNDILIEKNRKKLEKWTELSKARFEGGIKVRFIVIDDYDEKDKKNDEILRELYGITELSKGIKQVELQKKGLLGYEENIEFWKNLLIRLMQKVRNEGRKSVDSKTYSKTQKLEF